MNSNTPGNHKNIIKPISILTSIWYFIISSLLIYFGLYRGIPILLDKGLPFLSAYLILFYLPFVLLFITALVLYRREGNQWNWSDFKKRLFLNKMSKTDWLWALGLLIFGLITYLGLTPLGNLMAKISFLSPPDFFPAEINPNKPMVSGIFMDYKLAGQYWVPVAYFFGWVFNILGEEFLWRGMILPRQIKKYGNKAWIYHGIIWTFWHFFWGWNLIIIFPFAMAVSYVFYKRQTTFIPILTHGLMNLIPLILIISDVFK
jgi:membrane protease YdiL (CAAX protease family)